MSSVGNRHLHRHELISLPSVLLDSLPLDPELPPRLRPGRNPQHHLLAVERANPEARAQHRLGHVDRHLADDVEPFAVEEAVGLHLEGDDEIAGRRRPAAPGCPWPAETHPRTRLGAGWHVITTRRSVRTSPAPAQVGHGWDGILPAAAALGHGRLTAKPPWPNEMVPRPLHSGQVDQVAPGAPPVPGRSGQVSVTASVTGTLPPSDGHTERHLDHGLEGLGRRLLPAAPAENGREDVAQAAEIAELDVLRRRATAPARPAPRPPPARRGPPRRAVERPVAAHLVVLLALLGVGEHAVRLGDLLEALGCLGRCSGWRPDGTAWRAAGRPS